ncbi:MAG TPA: Coq4 family protein [Vitreimonas sp.]|nr:Coq4 family protein [Vitreimonas sp.]
MQTEIDTARFQTGLAAAVTQILAARLTRMALALESTSRLTPYPDVEDELSKLDCDEFYFSETRPCVPGTLGEGCVRFWHRNAIKPFAVSPPSAMSPGEKLLVRRLLLHDVCHVLLDLKSDWCGQLGVFCFIASQRYCPEFEWSARRLAQIYVTAAPWQRDELAASEADARRLGLAAPRLLTMPIEREWDTSLVWLRDKLKIRKMRTLGAIPDDVRAEAPSSSNGGGGVGARAADDFYVSPEAGETK